MEETTIFPLTGAKELMNSRFYTSAEWFSPSKDRFKICKPSPVPLKLRMHEQRQYGNNIGLEAVNIRLLHTLKDFRKERNPFKEPYITQKVQHERSEYQGFHIIKNVFLHQRKKVPMQFSFHAAFWKNFPP